MSLNVDMRVRLGSLELRNPVVTASGTFASGREFADFVDLSRLGAIVTKGVSLGPWAGNASPRIAETASGMLNSIGLQNPGVEAFVAKDLAWLAENAPETPVIVNVSGHSVEEYVGRHRAARAGAGVAAYEVNISCPNVDAGRHGVRDRLRGGCRRDRRVPGGDEPPAHREAEPQRHRHRRDRDARSRRPAPTGSSLINTLLGHGDRRGDRASRCSPASSAGCPVRRSSRSRCGWCGRSPTRSRSRSSAWAASWTRRTPSSSCWPAPPRSRWERRTSSTRPRRRASSTASPSTATATASTRVADLIGALGGLSRMTNPFKWFIENFGKAPEPRPPLIPAPWRIPFFAAVSVVSLVGAARCSSSTWSFRASRRSSPPAPSPVVAPAN